MKVFVSSLISCMEPLRSAACDAITTLRHEPIMAEDFGASPNTPQIACMSGLRDAEVVFLILGAGYGVVQASGLSATHEEYEEAKGQKPVFAFVQEGVQREAKEADLYGKFRAGNPDCSAAASEPLKIYGKLSSERYTTTRSPTSQDPSIRMKWLEGRSLFYQLSAEATLRKRRL